MCYTGDIKQSAVSSQQSAVSSQQSAVSSQQSAVSSQHDWISFLNRRDRSYNSISGLSQFLILNSFHHLDSSSVTSSRLKPNRKFLYDYAKSENIKGYIPRHNITRFAILKGMFTLLFFVITVTSHVYAALSTTTANTIQGTAPYLTFDGTTKELTTSGFLRIKLSDGTTITAPDDTSTSTNPITLPNIMDTFEDIITLVAFPNDGNSGYPTIALNSLISASNDYWIDDDGDSNATATGSLTVQWQDDSSTDITSTVKTNPNTILSGCYSPYKLTLTATTGTLSTQYGFPKTSSLTGSNHSYYIEPKINTPYACFSEPNLVAKGGVHTGPASQWDDKYGFLLQDVDTPASNFPTVGANGLFFELRLAGAAGSSVTVIKTPSTSNVSLNITASGNAIKAELIGPKNGDTAAQAAFTPTTFDLYSGTTKIYSFTLGKWFIVKPENSTYYNASIYCSNLGYRVPSVAEYTNSNGNGWNGGLSGQPNRYQRRIGGGLLSEWGSVHDGYYTNSDFEYVVYWANESYNAANQFHIKSDDGVIGYDPRTHNIYHRAGCVAP